MINETPALLKSITEIWAEEVKLRNSENNSKYYDEMTEFDKLI